MFKVGDRVIVTGTMGHLILIGSEVTVLEIGDNPSSGLYKVEDKGGLTQWVNECDLRPISPPQKITQNGYEYSLVGPVKPEWLVDGAWVVSRITGKLYKVLQVSNCKFQAVNSDGTNNSGNLTSEEFSSAYRPHTASEWKWGDWALYRGKRVFVIGRVESIGMIAVSALNIDRDGEDEYDKNYAFIRHSELTPTF